MTTKNHSDPSQPKATLRREPILTVPGIGTFRFHSGEVRRGWMWMSYGCGEASLIRAADLGKRGLCPIKRVPYRVLL